MPGSSLRVVALAAAILAGVPSGAQRPAPAPIPQEMARRFGALHSSLRPSARSWVDQQARLEAQKASPDLAGLHNALRGRFPSLNSGNASAADIEAVVFIVLTQAVNDTDQDLQTQMAATKALTNAKAEARALLEKVEQYQSALAAKAPNEDPNSACTAPFCRDLPQLLDKLAADSAPLPHPMRIKAPANLTYGQLSAIKSQLTNQMNSLNDMSETQSLELQMSMDRRSKLIETLSNVLKKVSDTSDAIVANLK